jgi:hypothetical protein
MRYLKPPLPIFEIILIMLREKLPDAFLSTKVVAARGNGFSPRNVALTVKTSNQFQLLIGMLLRSLKTLRSVCDEKLIDTDNKNVGKHKKDKQSKSKHGNSLNQLLTTR